MENEKIIIIPEEEIDRLGKDDLVQILNVSNRCLACSNEAEFGDILLSFATFLKFEFVLYCYSKESYTCDRSICWMNVSNPAEWDAEYESEEYLPHDPVRLELVRKMETGVNYGFINWDAYKWKLSSMNQLVIDRRKQYGLNYGFSVFMNSTKKDFTFLFSFASETTRVEEKEELFSKLLTPHLLATRKRLDMLALITTLSGKEKLVVHWLMDSKSNWEISQLLNITENTVKFHMKNIFSKLQVTNRQQAASVFLAERYLSI